MLIGLLVIIGWHAHWPFFIQLRPTLAPMKYNTALSFILSGLGLILLNTKVAKWVPYLGAVVGLIGLCTWLEYLTGRNLGIDQLLFKTDLSTATLFPGRMSQLSASCLLLMGAALVLAPLRGRGFLLCGMIACMLAVIAAVAILGYLCGIESAYRWGAYTRMALHTAITFLVWAVGFWQWSSQKARQTQPDFSRWLPVTGSLTLIVMIGVISAASLAELRQAVFWRGRTYQALNTAAAFIGSLTDTQRGMRGYILTGMPLALEPYQSGTNNAPQQLAALKELTQDDPRQQERIVWLQADLSDVVHYSQKLLALNQSAGIEAAMQLEKTGRGLAVMNKARADLDIFIQAEQALLVKRDAAAGLNFNNTMRLLVMGSVLAGALLVFANLKAAHEARQRRHAENQLRETLTLKDAILNSANYAIISSSASGVATFNATAERWLGYSAAEIIGKTTPAKWHDPQEIQARAAALTRELGHPVEPGFDVFAAKARLGKVDENEWTFIRKDGTRFPALVSITALENPNSPSALFLGIITDLTEQKRREAALRVTEERFSRAFDDAPIGMALVGPEGRWLKVNRALCGMLGYTNTELLAIDFQRITHPDDLEKDLALLKQVLDGTLSSYQLEKRYFRKSGQTVDALLSVSLVRDEAGLPLYFVSQIENITERKAAEEALRLTGDQLKALTERLSVATQTAGMGVWDWDIQTGKVNWDSTMLRLYGLPRDAEITYELWRNTVLPADLPQAEDVLQQAIQEKMRGEMEFRITRPDGSVRHIQSAISVILDHEENVAQMIGINLDITEARRRELERDKIIAELQELLMQIKTLSGLIPICGWCKSVRSDQGYWQTVEQYVRANTAATFSHGICPDCAEKMKNEIENQY